MFETAMTPAADETGGKRLHSFRQEAHIPTGIPLCKGGPSPWKKNGEKRLRVHSAAMELLRKPSPDPVKRFSHIHQRSVIVQRNRPDIRMSV